MLRLPSTFCGPCLCKLTIGPDGVGSPINLSCWLSLQLLGRHLGQVLLQALLCTPPLVYFCRTGLCASSSTLNWSISNSRSILSPNPPLTPKRLVSQVEDYSFPVTTVTNYHKLLKTRCFSLTELELRSPKLLCPG